MHHILQGEYTTEKILNSARTDSKLTAAKTKLNVLGSPQNMRYLPDIKVAYQDHPLFPVSEVKNIGQVFDRSHSWTAHGGQQKLPRSLGRPVTSAKASAFADVFAKTSVFAKTISTCWTTRSQEPETSNAS